MTVRALQRHIGRHQEELALFALPHNLEDTHEMIEDADNDSINVPRNVEEWGIEETSDFSDGESADSRPAINSATFPKLPHEDLDREAVALFNFEKENEDELNMVEGQRLWKRRREEEEKEEGRRLDGQILMAEKRAKKEVSLRITPSSEGLSSPSTSPKPSHEQDLITETQLRDLNVRDESLARALGGDQSNNDGEFE